MALRHGLRFRATCIAAAVAAPLAALALCAGLLGVWPSRWWPAMIAVVSLPTAVLTYLAARRILEPAEGGVGANRERVGLPARPRPGNDEAGVPKD